MTHIYTGIKASTTVTTAVPLTGSVLSFRHSIVHKDPKQPCLDPTIQGTLIVTYSLKSCTFMSNDHYSKGAVSCISERTQSSRLGKLG